MPLRGFAVHSERRVCAGTAYSTLPRRRPGVQRAVYLFGIRVHPAFDLQWDHRPCSDPGITANIGAVLGRRRPRIVARGEEKISFDMLVFTMRIIERISPSPNVGYGWKNVQVSLTVKSIRSWQFSFFS